MYEGDWFKSSKTLKRSSVNDSIFPFKIITISKNKSL